MSEWDSRSVDIVSASSRSSTPFSGHSPSESHSRSSSPLSLSSGAHSSLARVIPPSQFDFTPTPFPTPPRRSLSPLSHSSSNPTQKFERFKLRRLASYERLSDHEVRLIAIEKEYTNKKLSKALARTVDQLRTAESTARELHSIYYSVVSQDQTTRAVLEAQAKKQKEMHQREVERIRRLEKERDEAVQKLRHLESEYQRLVEEGVYRDTSTRAYPQGVWSTPPKSSRTLNAGGSTTTKGFAASASTTRFEAECTTTIRPVSGSSMHTFGQHVPPPPLRRNRGHSSPIPMHHRTEPTFSAPAQHSPHQY